MWFLLFMCFVVLFGWWNVGVVMYLVVLIWWDGGSFGIIFVDYLVFL